MVRREAGDSLRSLDAGEMRCGCYSDGRRSGVAVVAAFRETLILDQGGRRHSKLISTTSTVTSVRLTVPVRTISVVLNFQAIDYGKDYLLAQGTGISRSEFNREDETAVKIKGSSMENPEGKSPHKTSLRSRTLQYLYNHISWYCARSIDDCDD